MDKEAPLTSIPRLLLRACATAAAGLFILVGATRPAAADCSWNPPQPPDPVPPGFDYTPLAQQWCAQLDQCTGAGDPSCVSTYLMAVAAYPPSGADEYEDVDTDAYTETLTCEDSDEYLDGDTDCSTVQSACTPDAGAFDAGSGGGGPDSGGGDAGSGSGSGSGSGYADGGLTDGGGSGSGSGTTDASFLDASVGDGGSGSGYADGGVSDGGGSGSGGSPDASFSDAASSDASPVDSGYWDAGPVDAGPLDASWLDAGRLDAGSGSGVITHDAAVTTDASAAFRAKRRPR